VRSGLLAQGLVVDEDDTPVEVIARPGLVARLDAADPASLGRVLTGHQRAHAGELVVDGLLLPEQREIVGERACLIEVDHLDHGQTRIADRAALVSMSRRHRRAFVGRTDDLLAELAAAVGASRQAVDGRTRGGAPTAVATEMALALASGADVFVLSGLESLDHEGRGATERLADELASRGLTVVMLAEGAAPAPIPAPEHRRDAVLAGGSPHE
jgi:hypothetical protein